MKFLLQSLFLFLPLYAFADASGQPADPLLGAKLTETPFLACRDQVLIEKTSLSEEARAQLVECGIEPQTVQNSAFFATVLRKIRVEEYADDAKERSKFLQRAGQIAARNAALNSKISDVVFHCAMGDKAWFDSQEEKHDLHDFSKCGKLLGDLRKVVSREGPKFRELAEVLRRQGNFWQSGKNTVRDSLGFGLPGEKAELSPEEKKGAEARIAADEKAVAEAFERERAVQQVKFDALLKKMSRADALHDESLPIWFKGFARESRPDSPQALLHRSMAEAPFREAQFNSHLREYGNVLDKAQILAYLPKGGVPDDAAIAAAASRVLVNNREEQRLINAMVADKAKESDTAAAARRLPLMKYTEAVQEALANGPKDCGVATGLVNYVQSWKDAKTTMMNGVSAAAILIPLGVAMAPAAVPAGAVGAVSMVGTAAGGISSMAFYYGTYARHLETADAKRRAVSTLHLDPELDGAGKAMGTAQDYLQARDDLATSLAWLSLNAAQKSYSGFNSGYAALKDRMENRAFARNLLRRSGMPDQEIDEFIGGIFSSDEGLRSRAVDLGLKRSVINENTIMMKKRELEQARVLKRKMEMNKEFRAPDLAKDPDMQAFLQRTRYSNVLESLDRDEGIPALFGNKIYKVPHDPALIRDLTKKVDAIGSLRMDPEIFKKMSDNEIFAFGFSVEKARHGMLRIVEYSSQDPALQEKAMRALIRLRSNNQYPISRMIDWSNDDVRKLIDMDGISDTVKSLAKDYMEMKKPTP